MWEHAQLQCSGQRPGSPPWLLSLPHPTSTSKHSPWVSSPPSLLQLPLVSQSGPHSLLATPGVHVQTHLAQLPELSLWNANLTTVPSENPAPLWDKA